MEKKIAYVGIDYHLNSLSIAVLIDGQKKLYDTIRLKNVDKIISKYMKKLSRDFQIKACYEASTNGYAFQRKMTQWGYSCDVIAPSLIPKKAGNRRKNDFRDARDLAQNFAAGMLSIVHPPSEDEEAVRSLVRCRTAFKDDAKRIKFKINSLLLSQDLRWPHSKWTFAHRKWLSEIQLPSPYLQEVLNEHLGHLHYMETRLKHLENQIEEIARSQIYSASVKKLRAFKGIGTLAAMILISEITDFRRFATPRALMAFLGLIPSENSSGDKQRGGSITKAGNCRCRTIFSAGPASDTILGRTTEIRFSSRVPVHIRKVNRIHAHLIPADLDTPSATYANITAQTRFCFLNRAIGRQTKFHFFKAVFSGFKIHHGHVRS